MASINITSPLGGSFVDSSFTVTGYGDPDGLTVQGSHNGIASNIDTVQGGLWSVSFVGASGKADVSVVGVNDGNVSDSEPEITVNNPQNPPPSLTITPLSAPPRLGAAAANPVSYKVKGKYNKRGKGVGVVCMLVNRNNKKVKDLVSIAPADLKANGDWEATLKFDAPGKGKRLEILAVMLDGNGSSVTVIGQTSPPAA